MFLFREHTNLLFSALPIPEIDGNVEVKTMLCLQIPTYKKVKEKINSVVSCEWYHTVPALRNMYDGFLTFYPNDPQPF